MINNSNNCIAVVIPSFRVVRHILDVLAKIGPEVSLIYVVDDKCPDQSGRFVRDNCNDPRVTVIFHEENRGVGGAVMTGYDAAARAGATIIVKVDGDGQMDPRLIPHFVAPILAGEADYTKGNRFYNLDKIRKMPPLRLFGNAVLSLITKFSTGYWNVFDPTNGYTAIHLTAAKQLPSTKISNRYFFESDMLFRLNTIRAVVIDVPMDAVYDDEVSNLKITKVITEFFAKHLINFFKRLLYNYYLRNMSIASIELPLGLTLIFYGSIFGAYHWFKSASAGIATPIGTVMLATLPILLGTQLILAFLAYDISSIPTRPLQRVYLPALLNG